MRRLTVSSHSCFVPPFPTLSSAGIWQFSDLWDGQERRGQKQRSYLSETAVNLLLWSSLLWYMFQVDSLWVAFMGVLKSFCFSSNLILTFSTFCPRWLTSIDNIRGLLHLVICLSCQWGQWETRERRQAREVGAFAPLITASY